MRYIEPKKLVNVVVTVLTKSIIFIMKSVIIISMWTAIKNAVFWFCLLYFKSTRTALWGVRYKRLFNTI